MPVLVGYGTPQRPYRPEHKPDPEQQDPSQLTALTPQNQPGRPLLRGNQYFTSLYYTRHGPEPCGRRGGTAGSDYGGPMEHRDDAWGVYKGDLLARGAPPQVGLSALLLDAMGLSLQCTDGSHYTSSFGGLVAPREVGILCDKSWHGIFL